MKKQRFIAPLIMLLMIVVAYSCDTSLDNGWTDPPKDVKGYKPVYVPAAAAYTVSIEAPQTLKKPGKIYIYGGLLFIVERNAGIHVVNNQNTSNPQFVHFIKVPGCVDVAVKNGMLYADNITDLVVFDITNINNISFKSRVKDSFPNGLKLYPEMASNQYFECVDTTKGIVIDWELTTLNNPKCYR